MTLSLPRPPHRLERLRSWMDGEGVSCTVVLRRRPRQPPVRLLALLRRAVRARHRPRRRAHARRACATRCRSPTADSGADEVVGYGERGFGIDLDPVADLVAAVAAIPAVAAARRIGVASRSPARTRASPRRVSGTVVACRRGTVRGSGWSRTGTSWRRSMPGTSCAGSARQAVADAAVPGVSEIELFTAAQSTAQVASGGPIEFVCDLLSGPNTAEVCCPVHVAGPRASSRTATR